MQTKEKIKKLNKQVEYCLREFENTRNSDILLMIKVWQTFHGDLLYFVGDNLVVNLKSLYLLPREDNIKRVRAQIQNVKRMFLPTDPAVRKKRKITELVWRSYLTNENLNY